MIKKLNGCILWLKMTTFWKNIILFGIKSALILKNNLIANLSITQKFLKTKIKYYRDEVRDFYNKTIPKVDSNHTSLAGISLDSALKKDESYYPQAFLKECKYIEKEKKRC